MKVVSTDDDGARLELTDDDLLLALGLLGECANLLASAHVRRKSGLDPGRVSALFAHLADRRESALSASGQRDDVTVNLAWIDVALMVDAADFALENLDAEEFSLLVRFEASEARACQSKLQNLLGRREG